MRYVEVPAPITLLDLDTKKPLKIQKVIDGKVVLADAEPTSAGTFALENLTPNLKGFKEYKSGERILRAFEKAEDLRAQGATAVAEFEEEDYKLLMRLIEGLQMNGYQGIQYLPFMEALEAAKSEKPRALKSVDTEKKDA